LSGLELEQSLDCIADVLQSADSKLELSLD